MRTQWEIRVFTSQSRWWTWREDSEALAKSRAQALMATGFRANRPRGPGKRLYPPAAILFIDILPPHQKAGVPA